MKPKLYQYAACPFCHKVRSILAYKGVDFETIEVHPFKKTQISFSEYRAVPIYIDSSGKQVNDSTPIMRWIDREFPEPKVFETDSEAVEKEEAWLAWSEKLVQGLPAVLYDHWMNSLRAFDYITKTGSFGWLERRMIKYSGAFVMTMVGKKIRKREGIRDPAGFLRQKADEWAEGLNGRPFMGGEKPNGADLAVFGIVQAVAGLPAARILEDNPSFFTWMERTRQAVKASAESFAAKPSLNP